MFRTNTRGLTLETTKGITKNDIINMCDLLNNKEEYSNLCKFQPEAITEGGIKFNFKVPGFDEIAKKQWYKSVRFYTQRPSGTWYGIDNNTCVSDWTGSDDIIFNKKSKFTMFLKSHYGSPLFTQEELKIWEECFNKIGIIKVGRYPAKKHLKGYISERDRERADY
jgi:hypothetical protein